MRRMIHDCASALYDLAPWHIRHRTPVSCSVLPVEGPFIQPSAPAGVLEAWLAYGHSDLVHCGGSDVGLREAWQTYFGGIDDPNGWVKEGMKLLFPDLRRSSLLRRMVFGGSPASIGRIACVYSKGLLMTSEDRGGDDVPVVAYGFDGSVRPYASSYVELLTVSTLRRAASARWVPVDGEASGWAKRRLGGRVVAQVSPGIYLLAPRPGGDMRSRSRLLFSDWDVFHTYCLANHDEIGCIPDPMCGRYFVFDHTIPKVRRLSASRDGVTLVEYEGVVGWLSERSGQTTLTVSPRAPGLDELEEQADESDCEEDRWW